MDNVGKSDPNRDCFPMIGTTGGTRVRIEIIQGDDLQNFYMGNAAQTQPRLRQGYNNSLTDESRF